MATSKYVYKTKMLSLVIQILSANHCETIKNFYEESNDSCCTNAANTLNTFSACYDQGDTFRSKLSCTDAKPKYQGGGCCPTSGGGGEGSVDLCTPKQTKYERCIVGSGAGALGVVLGLQDSGKDHNTLMIEKGRSTHYYDSLVGAYKPTFNFPSLAFQAYYGSAASNPYETAFDNPTTNPGANSPVAFSIGKGPDISVHHNSRTVGGQMAFNSGGFSASWEQMRHWSASMQNNLATVISKLGGPFLNGTCNSECAEINAFVVAKGYEGVTAAYSGSTFNPSFETSYTASVNPEYYYNSSNIDLYDGNGSGQDRKGRP